MQEEKEKSFKILPCLLVLLAFAVGWFFWNKIEVYKMEREEKEQEEKIMKRDKLKLWVEETLKERLTKTYPKDDIKIKEVYLFMISDEVYDCIVETTVQKKNDNSKEREVDLDLKVRANKNIQMFSFVKKEQLWAY